jgi:ferritin-like metal-binding protein YciE
VVSSTASSFDQACSWPHNGQRNGIAATLGMLAKLSLSVSMPTATSSFLVGQRIMIAPIAASVPAPWLNYLRQPCGVTIRRVLKHGNLIIASTTRALQWNCITRLDSPGVALPSSIRAIGAKSWWRLMKSVLCDLLEAREKPAIRDGSWAHRERGTNVSARAFGGAQTSAGVAQMQVTDLNDLFVHTLKDIYFAEKQIVKALPKMVKKADSKELAKLLEAHLEETKEQITRLEEVFKLLGKKAAGEECPAIEGILEEADELMGSIKDADTRDAAMIAAAQAVEHYEITRYGTLASWGKLLGHKDAVKLLEATLKEEHSADSKLTKIAESKLNKQAA